MVGNGFSRMGSLLTLLLSLVLFSCQKEQDCTTLELRIQNLSSAGKTYIYQEGAQNIACWAPLGSATEKVRINNASYEVAVPDNNAASNIFASIPGVASAETYYALYPSNLAEGLVVDASTSISLPMNEVYRCINHGGSRQLLDTPMAGKASGSTLLLRPLEGVLEFQISGSGWLEYIEIQNESNSLSGSASVTIGAESATLTMNNEANCRTKRLTGIHTQLSNNAQSFYLNLPSFSNNACHIILGIRESEQSVTRSYKRDRASASVVQGCVMPIAINCNNAVPNGFSAYENGSEYQPFIINGSNISTLSANATGNKHFVLEEDISMSSTLSSFNGVLDGNGRTVTLSHPLVGTLSGTVKNLTTAGTIVASGDECGAIANKLTGGSILNCTNNASITNNSAHSGYVGGICSKATSTCNIQKCVNNGTIYSIGTYTGGIVGYTVGPISNCINNGRIYTHKDDSRTEQRYIGGIAGQATSHLFNCQNSGCIVDTKATSSKNDYFGGILGIGNSNNNSTCYQIINCANTADITTHHSKAHSGGIISIAENSNIWNCYVRCHITSAFAGGISDNNKANCSVDNCYFYGSLSTTTNFSAGITRLNEADCSVTHCYSSFATIVRGNNGSMSGCDTLSDATTLSDGSLLVNALNSNRNSITGAREWVVNNGYVVFREE